MNKRINPNLIKLAELTHNPDLKINENILEEKVDIETSNVPNLNDYIYVPPIKLYVAKERTLYGKNWYGAHEELHKQGLQMLTIPEFIEFIKYLKNGYQNREEARQILDEILTAREPWRAEWLDAYFKVINGELHINYNHRTINGELKPGKSELLEDCLMENKLPDIDLRYWLKNATSQGLPSENIPQGNLWYNYPGDRRIARFSANSGGASLFCLGCSEGSDSSLVVRTAKTRN